MFLKKNLSLVQRLGTKIKTNMQANLLNRVKKKKENIIACD
jgi:hypothetical protein